MKIDVSVKNLGRLKDAEFRIRPMTVIAGANGSGKSFFTRFLYCILSGYNRSEVDSISHEIESKLKDNFKTNNLVELVAFDESLARIEVDGLLAIEIDDKKFSCHLEPTFADSLNVSSAVFLNSTGCLYALNSALAEKNKSECVFKAEADLLSDMLSGEFVFEDGALSFKDSQSGRYILSKLMSLGMQNIGTLHTLLKNNAITPGSFLFFDDLDANLHPDWQIKLINVLLKLAQSGVNIIITTHSAVAIKTLEVNLKKQKIDDEDFLSVHFIDGGQLFEFESAGALQQLIETRSLLNSAYEKLYFSDL